MKKLSLTNIFIYKFIANEIILNINFFFIIFI